MKNLFSGNGLKGKISAAVIALLTFGLIFIIIFVFSIAIVSPIAMASEKLEEYTNVVSTFFHNVGDFFKGFFEDKETFSEFLKNKHKEYLDGADVSVDIPLIAATIYYPNDLNLIKDENFLEDVLENKETAENEESLSLSLKKERATKLIRNMVKVTEITYSCYCPPPDPETGETPPCEITGEKSREEWMGDLPEFPTTLSCNGEEEKQYFFNLDYQKYDNYLRNYYFTNTEEYKKVLEDVGIDNEQKSEEENNLKITRIIDDIHDRSYYYKDIVNVEDYYSFGMLYGNLSKYNLLSYLKAPTKSSYRITSCYGRRILKDIGVNNHKGIDIVVADSRIYAAADGVITALRGRFTGSCYGSCEKGQYEGNYVHIRSKTLINEFRTEYLHLASVNENLQVGSFVKAGDFLGIQGETGNANGAHLHFGVRIGSNYINPGDLFINPTSITGSNCYSSS